MSKPCYTVKMKAENVIFAMNPIEVEMLHGNFLSANLFQENVRGSERAHI